MSVTWKTAQAVREAYWAPAMALPDGDPRKDDKLRLSRIIVDAWLDENVTGAGVRDWYTMQHVDGRVSGQWAHTAFEAQLWCEIMHGAEGVWCERDPGSMIHQRYHRMVPDEGRQAARWQVTEGPTDWPVLAGAETKRAGAVSVGETLF